MRRILSHYWIGWFIRPDFVLFPSLPNFLSLYSLSHMFSHQAFRKYPTSPSGVWRFWEIFILFMFRSHSLSWRHVRNPFDFLRMVFRWAFEKRESKWDKKIVRRREEEVIEEVEASISKGNSFSTLIISSLDSGQQWQRRVCWCIHSMNPWLSILLM